MPFTARSASRTVGRDRCRADRCRQSPVSLCLSRSDSSKTIEVGSSRPLFIDKLPRTSKPSRCGGRRLMVSVGVEVRTECTLVKDWRFRRARTSRGDSSPQALPAASAISAADEAGESRSWRMTQAKGTIVDLSSTSPADSRDGRSSFLCRIKVNDDDIEPGILKALDLGQQRHNICGRLKHHSNVRSTTMRPRHWNPALRPTGLSHGGQRSNGGGAERSIGGGVNPMLSRTQTDRQVGRTRPPPVSTIARRLHPCSSSSRPTSNNSRTARGCPPQGQDHRAASQPEIDRAVPASSPSVGPDHPRQMSPSARR